MKVGFEGWTQPPPGEVLFSDAEIRAREIELVRELAEDYDFNDPEVLCVAVLKGGLPFFLDMTELIRQMTGREPRTAFIATKTYDDGRQASTTRITQDIPFDITGLRVLAFEDVSDTNRTGNALNRHILGERRAASFELLPLFIKDVPDKVGPDPARCGFRAPNRWIGGMGLDLGDPADPDAGRAYRDVFAID